MVSSTRSSKEAKRSTERAILLYAPTDVSADALYLSGARVPDAFVAVVHNGEKIAIVSPLEFNRMQRQSHFDTVLSLVEYQDKARQQFRVRHPEAADTVRVLAKERKIRSFVVPGEFPVGLAKQLEARKLRFEPVEGSVFPEREKKTEGEVAEIRKANRACAAGFRVVEKALRESKIQGRRLIWRGKTLTSERLHEAIGVACFEKGAVPAGTIVAGGDQGCDPHEHGHGPLRPHELIVVDIFPRLTESGYHGDMTRTYLKGKATEEQKRLVATVKAAQDEALGMIKSGVASTKVHHAVAGYFSRHGYQTGPVDGVHQGFFHGTGHGLGLEIHEAPRLSLRGGRLKLNAVTTVEPGLYYPGLGGCRIEDVVRVTRTGCEMLSKHSYRWRIA